jgi:DNA repair exonuclease SbcCD ATPase subunit
MNSSLFRVVWKRLTEDSDADDDLRKLVRIACLAPSSLHQPETFRDDHPLPDPEDSGDATSESQLYWKRLSVRGFRGIGEEVSLVLDPSPGLTIVSGRNGSGKSSLAEAFEALLYNDLQRWEKRPAAWTRGWANVHSEGPVYAEAEFVRRGDGDAFIARRTWPDRKAKLGKSRVALKHGKENAPSLSGLPGYALRDTFRPMLSYGELGRQLEGKPAELFDKVAQILGLESLKDARKNLSTARSNRKKRVDEVEGAAGKLIAELEPIEDERAREALDALRTPGWDLDALQATLEGRSPASRGIAQLRRIAGTEVARIEDIRRLETNLQEKLDEAEKARASDSGVASALATLLRKAVDFHGVTGDLDACPVCEQPCELGDAWRQSARLRIAEAEAAAVRMQEAEEEVELARGHLEGLLPDISPEDLTPASQAGLAITPLETLQQIDPTDPRELLDFSRRHAAALLQLVDALVRRCLGTLTDREYAWARGSGPPRDVDVQREGGPGGGRHQRHRPASAR